MSEMLISIKKRVLKKIDQNTLFLYSIESHFYKNVDNLNLPK